MEWQSGTVKFGMMQLVLWNYVLYSGDLGWNTVRYEKTQWCCTCKIWDDTVALWNLGWCIWGCEIMHDTVVLWYLERNTVKYEITQWCCKIWDDAVKVKVHNPITGLDRPRGFQEVEAPRFQDNRHMKMVRLSALRTGHLYPPGNIHFC